MLPIGVRGGAGHSGHAAWPRGGSCGCSQCTRPGRSRPTPLRRRNRQLVRLAEQARATSAMPLVDRGGPERHAVLPSLSAAARRRRAQVGGGRVRLAAHLALLPPPGGHPDRPRARELRRSPSEHFSRGAPVTARTICPSSSIWCFEGRAGRYAPGTEAGPYVGLNRQCTCNESDAHALTLRALLSPCLPAVRVRRWRRRRTSPPARRSARPRSIWTRWPAAVRRPWRTPFTPTELEALRPTHPHAAARRSRARRQHHPRAAVRARAGRWPSSSA